MKEDIEGERQIAAREKQRKAQTKRRHAGEDLEDQRHHGNVGDRVENRPEIAARLGAVAR